MTIQSNATQCDNIPDADINGIGVLTAYLFGPYSLFLLTVILYACGRVPHHFLNDYDKIFLKIKPRPSAQWVTGQGFFAFSIQQLVFGISMLAAGFGTFRERTLFDFQTVIWTAWMSATAHLFTLLLLRDHCRSHLWVRVLELGGMLILMVMLCVALYPTTNWDWASHVLRGYECFGVPYCKATQKSVSSMWNEVQQARVTTSTSPQAVLNYTIILSSYIWQTTSLLQERRPLLQILCCRPLTWIGGAVANVPAEPAKGIRTLSKLMYRSMLLGLYFYTLAVLETISSFACRLLILAVALGWGTMQLLIPRFHMLHPCVRSALNQWSFGQVLPMIILLSPLYGVLEFFSTKNTGTAPHPPTTLPQSVQNTPRPVGDRVSVLFKKVKDKEPAAQETLHNTLHTTLYFQMLLCLLTLTAIGSAAGLFAETVVAYIQPYPYTWWTQDWHLWPDVVAMLCVLTLVFIFAIIGPMFSKTLSS